MRLVSTRHMPKKDFDKLDEETKELYDKNLPVELAMNLGRVLAPFVKKDIVEVDMKETLGDKASRKCRKIKEVPKTKMIEWTFELDIMTTKQREYLNNYLSSRMSQVDFIGFSELMVDFSKDNANKIENK